MDLDEFFAEAEGKLRRAIVGRGGNPSELSPDQKEALREAKQSLMALPWHRTIEGARFWSTVYLRLDALSRGLEDLDGLELAGGISPP